MSGDYQIINKSLLIRYFVNSHLGDRLGSETSGLELARRKIESHERFHMINTTADARPTVGDATTTVDPRVDPTARNLMSTAPTPSTAERPPLPADNNNSGAALHLARRVSVGIGLGTIAAIHILDLPGKFAETRYIAYMYLAVIVVAIVLLERLLVVGSRRDFLFSAILAAIVVLAFVVNRTSGMPGATGDIGNWFEPLGLLSLAVEVFVIWQSLAAVASFRSKKIRAS